MKRFISTFVIVYFTLCAIPFVYAENAKKHITQFSLAEKEGTAFVAVGRMLPKELWGEYKKLLKALREARKAERQAHRRLKELLDETPANETFLLNKFGAIDAALKDLGHRIDTLNGAVYVMGEDINTFKHVLSLYMGALERIFNMLERFEKELATKKSKDEGWSFGVTAYGSAEYATNKEDFMPIGGAALTAAWHKNNLMMNLMFGAGASVIDGAALSWTFLPSLLFDITPYLSLGPAIVVTQDLGGLEGADRMIYAGGCKVQTAIWKYFNVWAVPAFGVHVERGYGAGGPTTSFNAGVTAGVDYMFLK